jgi:hypothetical protein
VQLLHDISLEPLDSAIVWSSTIDFLAFAKAGA